MELRECRGEVKPEAGEASGDSSRGPAEAAMATPVGATLGTRSQAQDFPACLPL